MFESVYHCYVCVFCRTSARNTFAALRPTRTDCLQSRPSSSCFDPLLYPCSDLVLRQASTRNAAQAMSGEPEAFAIYPRLVERRISKPDSGSFCSPFGCSYAQPHSFQSFGLPSQRQVDSLGCSCFANWQEDPCVACTPHNSMPVDPLTATLTGGHELSCQLSLLMHL